MSTDHDGEEVGAGERLKYPSNTGIMWAAAIPGAAISLVPVLGGPAAELFNTLVGPALEKRRVAWLEELARAVDELMRKVDGLTPANLTQSEVFLTTLLQASQQAMRAHQRAKLRALRNAVLNSALPGAPDDDLQLIYLDALGSLTAWHLRLLRYFEAPTTWGRRHGIAFPTSGLGSSIGQMLVLAMPELQHKQDFYKMLYNALATRGFVEGDASVFGISATPQGCLSPRTTQFGRGFLQFVTSPVPELDDDAQDEALNVPQ